MTFKYKRRFFTRRNLRSWWETIQAGELRPGDVLIRIKGRWTVPYGP